MLSYRNRGHDWLRRLRWLRYLTAQPPKYANGQLRSFLSQAPISLSLDNQTSSAGVAPNKNKKNVHIFHEYFEYITSAAHFDVINYCIT
jgi:hypothetical protein